MGITYGDYLIDSGYYENAEDDDAELERILAMSDEEILAECIANGEDPAEVAREGRAIFERALAQVTTSSARQGG